VDIHVRPLMYGAVRSVSGALTLETTLTTTANLTVHSPLNPLCVHLLSTVTPCVARAYLDRQTTGGRGGQTPLLTSAWTHLQPMHVVSEFSIPPHNR